MAYRGLEEARPQGPWSDLQLRRITLVRDNDILQPATYPTFSNHKLGAFSSSRMETKWSTPRSI